LFFRERAPALPNQSIPGFESLKNNIPYPLLLLAKKWIRAVNVVSLWVTIVIASAVSMHNYIPHFIEFRRRLIQCSVIIGLIFLFFFCIDEFLYTTLATPLLKQLPQGGALIATEVTSTFTVPMKLALVAALFISMPYILYQIWTFVAPGLYRHEKKLILPVFFTSLLLFYLGVAFAYAIICPLALQFFVQTTPKNVTMLTDIRHYLDFVLTLLFAGGIAFQVPIFTFTLIRTGIVSIQQLSHFRPYIIVGTFVVGMLLTPPDVVSQILLALPMWGLFELGLLFGKYSIKNNNKQLSTIEISLK